MQITENSPRLRTLVKTVSEYAKGSPPTENVVIQVVNEYAKRGFTSSGKLIIQVVNEGLTSLEGEFEKAIGWTGEVQDVLVIEEGVTTSLAQTLRKVVVSERVGVSEMAFRRKRGSSTTKGKGKCFLNLDISI